MVDIIIPAYNGQHVIDRLLASIQIQLIVKDITVTIVNDGQGTYEENIKRFPLLKINEISYGENRGCGYARQYGIEHTHEPFLMFCDCDDALVGFDSVSYLLNGFNRPEINVVTSKILNIENTQVKEVLTENNDVWLHGKMFKRDFIEHSGVRFYSNSAGEDVGFNLQTIMFTKESEFLRLPAPTYLWTDWNKENRINTEEFAIFTSKKGLIENIIYAYGIGVKNKVPKIQLDSVLLENFIDLYINFNFYIGQLVDSNILNEDNLRTFIKWAIPVYELYKNINIENVEIEDIIFRRSIEFYSRFKYKGERYSFNEFVEMIKECGEKKDCKILVN